MRRHASKFSWFRTLTGAVSGFIVWALHFVAVYALVGVGCERAWDGWPIAGSNALTVLLVAVTLPALGAIAWIGIGGWRSAGRRPRDIDGPWRFTGWLTAAAAVLAFTATLMTALPILMLPPCE